jgi:hypothetical protein
MKKIDQSKSVLATKVSPSKLTNNRLLYSICMGSCFLVSSAVADHPTVAFGVNGAGGPIVTIAADTLPEGKFAAGVQNEFINNHALSTEQLEDYAHDGVEGVHSVDSISNKSIAVAYGVSDNFTISARLPYIVRSNIKEAAVEHGHGGGGHGTAHEEEHAEDQEDEHSGMGGHADALGTEGVHTHGDSSGFGDLLLLGQYRVYSELSTKVSLIVGVEIPTGETDVLDNDGNAFEAEFQPSSGSWDGLFGVAASKSIGEFGWFGNIMYTKNTEGIQDTKIGDALNYNLAVTYRINGSECQCNDTGSSTLKWDMVLEMNGENRSKNEIAGVAEANTGGNLLYFSPGVKVSSGNVGGFVSVGIPMVENHNGIQTDIDKRILVGLSMVF